MKTMPCNRMQAPLFGWGTRVTHRWWQQPAALQGHYLCFSGLRGLIPLPSFTNTRELPNAAISFLSSSYSSLSSSRMQQHNWIPTFHNRLWAAANTTPAFQELNQSSSHFQMRIHLWGMSGVVLLILKIHWKNWQILCLMLSFPNIKE